MLRRVYDIPRTTTDKIVSTSPADIISTSGPFFIPILLRPTDETKTSRTDVFDRLHFKTTKTSPIHVLYLVGAHRLNKIQNIINEVSSTDQRTKGFNFELLLLIDFQPNCLMV